LKVVLQTIWEELRQEHINRCLTAYSGRVRQWWSSRASAVTLSISKFASSSHHQQTSHQQTISKDNAWNAGKWGLSWLKQDNFVIFRHISTKLGGKVHTFCVTVAKKSAHIAEILTKVTGGVLFMLTLQTATHGVCTTECVTTMVCPHVTRSFTFL